MQHLQIDSLLYLKITLSSISKWRCFLSSQPIRRACCGCVSARKEPASCFHLHRYLTLFSAILISIQLFSLPFPSNCYLRIVAAKWRMQFGFEVQPNYISFLQIQISFSFHLYLYLYFHLNIYQYCFFPNLHILISYTYIFQFYFHLCEYWYILLSFLSTFILYSIYICKNTDIAFL